MRKIEIQSLATFKGKGVVWLSYKRRVNFDPILSKNFWREKIIRLFWPIKSKLHFSSSVNRATSISIYIHNLSFLSSYKGFDDDYRYSMANQTRKRRRHLPFPILLLLLRLPLICLPNKYWNPSLSLLTSSFNFLRMESGLESDFESNFAGRVQCLPIFFLSEALLRI